MTQGSWQKVREQMQIVIDIPEEEYQKILLTGKASFCAVNAIEAGTPLPKGHGRLIDANRLRSMYSINQANFNTVIGIQKWIDDAPTIIEADRESEES